MQTLPPSYPSWGQPLFGGPQRTADDVARMPDDGFRYEVYQGVLIRMPGTGEDHALICQFIGRYLDDYWRGMGELFRVVQNMGFDFTLAGDPPQTTMLVPDVAVKADNQRHGAGIGQTPPLIAVEVASPSDYHPEMAMKARFYLAAGVPEVWVVWPKSHTIDVWTAPTTPPTLDEQQALSTSHMPGWNCLVSHFFQG